MIIKNFNEIIYLINKKKGEAFDLKRARKWLVKSLPYPDFVKLTTVRFTNNRVAKPYTFGYLYQVSAKDDTPAKREKYLEYLYYKIYQNLATEGIELYDPRTV